MSKQAVSVTLEKENLLWLRGRARASACRSLSEALDQVIAEVRRSGPLNELGSRSVAGTIRIDAGDPELKFADVALRSLLGAALAKRKMRRARRSPKAGRG